jgi:hypothetical protein
MCPQDLVEGEAWDGQESPLPVETDDEVRGLHPDILILLERESKRVK